MKNLNELKTRRTLHIPPDRMENWEMEVEDYDDMLKQLKAREITHLREWLDQWPDNALNKRAFYNSLTIFYSCLHGIMKGRAFDEDTARDLYGLATEFGDHSSSSAAEFFELGRRAIPAEAWPTYARGKQFAGKRIGPDKLAQYLEFDSYHKANYIRGQKSKNSNVIKFCRLHKLGSAASFLKAFDKYKHGHPDQFDAETQPILTVVEREK